MKPLKSVIFTEHDWDIERLSYMTAKVCKQCGIKCHESSKEGGYSSCSYYTPKGDEIKTARGYEPNCTIPHEEYMRLLKSELVNDEST